MEKRKISFIYWFAYYNLDSPSVRYRAKYPLGFAKKKLRIGSYFVIPGYSPAKAFKFIRAYLSALIFPGKDSLIVIQRVRSNFIYSNLLKLLVKFRKSMTVYDLDDADYLEHSPETIHFFAQNCNYISAGSEEIIKYLSQFNPRIYHITSPTPDLGIIKQQRSKAFTIGWIGGFGLGHSESLYEYLFPAIRRLPFNCTFILIGVTSQADREEIKSYFVNCSHVQLEIPTDIDWNNESAIQNRIKLFDIGIATLLPNPIQISKSGIKAKQYMNNGVPVLCNNQPENNKVVIDGYNGFICESADEFRSRLIEFKEMEPQEYWKFSRNARKSIKDFDHYKYFEDFDRIKNNEKPLYKKRSEAKKVINMVSEQF